MAETEPAETEPAETEPCNHCSRPIPVTNLPLHLLHCQRHLRRCESCGEMVAVGRMAEHQEELHSRVACEQCGEEMERCHVAAHERSACSCRTVPCPFCEFPVMAMDHDTHVSVCGSRTDLCELCNKYVRKREQQEHQRQQHGDSTEAGSLPAGSRAPFTHASAEASTPRSRRDARRGAGGQEGGRGGTNSFGLPWLVIPVAVALAGVALVVGLRTKRASS